MNLKIEIAIRIICLIIIFILCIAVYVNGQKLSCDNCVVKFTQYRKLGMKLQKPTVIPIKLKDLYSNLSENNKCLIKWDRVNGYVIG